MFYKELPKKFYIIGSVDNSRLNTETGEDIHGKHCIFIWDNKIECKKFKEINKKFSSHPVSEVDRTFLSEALCVINYENKIPLKVSYIYLNPPLVSIAKDFDLTINNNSLIDVLCHYDYLIDVIEKYNIMINEFTSKFESWRAVQEDNERIMKQVLEALPKFRDRYIPSEVRREVWIRDGGSCKNCGSTYLIEFDHIIPVSKGGSNSAKNIEILCQECNRKKSNKDPGFH